MVVGIMAGNANEKLCVCNRYWSKRSVKLPIIQLKSLVLDVPMLAFMRLGKWCILIVSMNARCRLGPWALTVICLTRLQYAGHSRCPRALVRDLAPRVAVIAILLPINHGGLLF